MNKLKIQVDTHTHTVASGHAYGTLKENAQAACARGLAGFVCADHGPAIPDAAPAFILTASLAMVPDEIEGVRLIRGAEADIMEADGTLDIENKFLCATQFAIASLHTITFAPRSEKENTTAVLAALQNPYIDCIGHPGNPHYPVDREALVLETKRLGKVIEINNHSFAYRKGSAPNCHAFLRLCRKYDVPIVVSSDAHSSYAIGNFGLALAALAEEEFPEELVMNADFDRFLQYLADKDVPERD